jgi:hypothetical protein
MRGFAASLLFATAFVTSGCQSTIYKPVEVDMPVRVPCAAAAPQAPKWPTLSLAKDAGMAARTKALAAENELRKGYERQLTAAIGGCTA